MHHVVAERIECAMNVSLLQAIALNRRCELELSAETTRILRYRDIAAVKATFDISPAGKLTLADEQIPPLLAPEYRERQPAQRGDDGWTPSGACHPHDAARHRGQVQETRGRREDSQGA